MIIFPIGSVDFFLMIIEVGLIKDTNNPKDFLQIG
jgi:hypothetical protein